MCWTWNFLSLFWQWLFIVNIFNKFPHNRKIFQNICLKHFRIIFLNLDSSTRQRSRCKCILKRSAEICVVYPTSMFYYYYLNLFCILIFWIRFCNYFPWKYSLLCCVEVFLNNIKKEHCKIKEKKSNSKFLVDLYENFLARSKYIFVIDIAYSTGW